jgi:3-hydroxyacyl-[acyl-carrier-protein] dehydratase
MRFVLIDRLIHVAPGRSASAEKVFDPTLEEFADHFPGRPLVPGVLLTESMNQTAGWLILATTGFAALPLLVRIDRASFRRPVAPGETLTITATLKASSASAHEVMGEVRVQGDVVAEARLLFHCAEVPASSRSGDALVWARDVFAHLDGPAALERPA